MSAEIEINRSKGGWEAVVAPGSSREVSGWGATPEAALKAAMHNTFMRAVDEALASKEAS